MYRIKLSGQRPAAGQQRPASGRGSASAAALAKAMANLPTDEEPPQPPAAPRVDGVTKDTALLGWLPVKQNVSRIVIQALPLKRATSKVAWKHYNLKKGVGHQAIVSKDADKVNSGIVTGLRPGCFYVFRLIVSNMRGATEGETSAPVQTLKDACQAKRKLSWFGHRRRSSQFSEEQNKVDPHRHPHPKDLHPAKPSALSAPSTPTQPSKHTKHSKQEKHSNHANHATQDNHATDTVGEPHTPQGSPKQERAPSHHQHGHKGNHAAAATRAAEARQGGGGQATAAFVMPETPTRKEEKAAADAVGARAVAAAHAPHDMQQTTPKPAAEAKQDKGALAVAAEATTTRGAKTQPAPTTPQHPSPETVPQTGPTEAMEAATIPDNVPTTPVAAAASVGEHKGGKDGTAVPKSIGARLGVSSNSMANLKSKLEQLEQQRKQATKLFRAPAKDGVGHSKIYQALNPQKLWYESRREREEHEDDSVDVAVHGCVAGLKTGDGCVGGAAVLGYARIYDDDGNLIDVDNADEDDENDEDEDEDEMEGYDPDNLPDFGEFQEQMDKLRAERARKQEEQRKKMQQQWRRRKEEEQAALQREMAEIKKREDAIKKKKEVTAADVAVAQERIAAAAMFLGDFTFN